MFTTKRVYSLIMAAACVCAWPVYSQSTASGYDRMDGDYARPSRREVPTRNFNLSGKQRVSSETLRGEGSSTAFRPSAGSSAQDDRFESRAATNRNKAGRFRQPKSEATVVPAAEAGAESTAATEAAADVTTVEAADVDAPETAQPEVLPATQSLNEDQLVYCSKRLLEFHWDPQCANLKNVRPTRLTYKSAREARYAECTTCGGANRK